MKRIVLTGGGTAGHVTPNMALVPSLKEAGYDIQYIGSYNGIEKRLIEEMGIPYHGISSGKLRRYFDPKNFSDPFKVMKGYLEASHMIRKLKPDIVFSKGGFVSVPVVVQSGIGKVNMAICTQILVNIYGVDMLINTGVAGGLYKDINVGDIVISSDALQHDFDVTGLGYKKSVIPGMETSVFTADT